MTETKPSRQSQLHLKKESSLKRKAYKYRLYRRRDFLHQTARTLVKRYRVLVFEDLAIVNMTTTPVPKQDEQTGKYLANGAAAKGGLNTSILDAGWGQFMHLCACKAEEAGGSVVRVSPKDTTQAGSKCQRIVPRDLSERWHSCPFCGTELDRDHNAALNILKRYQEQRGAGRVPQVPASLCGEDASICRSPRL